MGSIGSTEAKGSVVTTQNPLRGTKLYVDPTSDAAKQAVEWQASRPDDAADMSRLATQPTAKWLTSADSLDEDLNAYLADASAAGAVPTLVVYNIPHRDCGLYSAGGADSLGAYKSYIDELAKLIAAMSTIIIIEPDAIPNLLAKNDNEADCLTKDQQQEYYQALNYAVEALGGPEGSHVYLDAGNSAWINDTPMLAKKLRQAGILKADGFSLNVSNFQTNSRTITYGKTLSKQLDGKHFVIDTSRNGAGAYKNPTYADFSWCNPPNRALGHVPTVSTGEPLVDAFLYIKVPGESDGNDPDPKKCFSGPRAGAWSPEYALGLIQRWPKELQPR
jgi:endoglucanase